MCVFVLEAVLAPGGQRCTSVLEAVLAPGGQRCTPALEAVLAPGGQRCTPAFEAVLAPGGRWRHLVAGGGTWWQGGSRCSCKSHRPEAEGKNKVRRLLDCWREGGAECGGGRD